MTFKDMQDLVGDWLDDVDFGYFKLPIVKKRLNLALKEVQKELIAAGQDWYVRCAQTNLVINEELYQFPSDFLKVNALRATQALQGSQTNWQDVTPMTRSQRNQLPNQTAMPTNYFLDKQYFHLLPIPDNTYIIELEYTYLVEDMVLDIDVPDCPPQYQELIPILCVLDGFIKDGRDMSAIIKKKDDYLKLMKIDSQQRKIDRPRKIIGSLNGYGSY